MSSGAGLGEMPWQREASERPWGEARGKTRGSPAMCQALATLTSAILTTSWSWITSPGSHRC